MRPLASIVLIFALVACAETKKDSSSATTDSGSLVTQSASQTAAGQEGPPKIPEACHVGPRPNPNSDWSKFVSPLDDVLPNGQRRELGVGVAILRSEWSGGVFKGDFGTDSMIVRREPDGGAPIIARVVMRSMMDRGVQNICRGLSFSADSSLYNRHYFFETGLRSLAALPVDSVTADSSWLRVIYAIDTSFALHRGWVEAAGSAAYTPWLTIFKTASDTAMIILRDSVARANPGPLLRTAPDGPLASVKLPSDAADWTMYLHRVEGQWGEIHIELGDVCGEDDIKQVPGRYWVRLVDDRGRPLVRLPAGEVC